MASLDDIYNGILNGRYNIRNSTDSIQKLADYYYDQFDFLRTIYLYDQLIFHGNVSHDDIMIYMHRIGACYSLLARYKDAEYQYRAVIETSKVAKTRVSAMLSLAFDLQICQRLSEAENLLLEAKALNVNVYDYAIDENLASIYYLRKDFTVARKIYDAMLVKYPEKIDITKRSMHHLFEKKLNESVFDSIVELLKGVTAPSD